ncbi:DUF3489 domain-containing protein [Lysobacter antibioticus]|uniref:DUF3489 domain-containing protein n=1 Tax=Lysobacter antibioticus TaxID=84531 RepID=UPI00034877BD|nr:DUF3489 domain-containing protein [Lysobacter antibioticus]
MSTIELSPNQRSVLELALDTEGRIERYPASLQGGARTSVVRGLLRNELVEAHDAGYRLTAAGYAAIGANEPAGEDTASQNAGAEPEADAGEGTEPSSDHALPAPEPAPAPARPKRAERGDTKLATVVGMLMRPEGATIAEIMTKTAWQQHSVRGFLAGAVKKKGYTVTNTKEGQGDRVYRIATKAPQADAGNTGPQADEEE